jgi:DNA modification methylase
MQRYSFTISLRIWHPSIDPAMITGTLGLPAQHSATAGQPRKTPKGHALDGVHAESYWHSDPFERGEYSSTDESAEDALAEVLQVLKPNGSFLVLLRNQGARIHLQVSSFSGRNYALELSPEFLAGCAELGISVVHDVYPYAQNW